MKRVGTAKSTTLDTSRGADLLPKCSLYVPPKPLLLQKGGVFLNLR